MLTFSLLNQIQCGKQMASIFSWPEVSPHIPCAVYRASGQLNHHNHMPRATPIDSLIPHSSVSEFMKLKCCLGNNTACRELLYRKCNNVDLLHWKGQGPDARYHHQAVLCCSAFTWLNACRRGQSSAGGQWCGLKALLSLSLKKPQQRCPWAKQLTKMCLLEILCDKLNFFHTKSLEHLIKGSLRSFWPPVLMWCYV